MAAALASGRAFLVGNPFFHASKTPAKKPFQLSLLFGRASASMKKQASGAQSGGGDRFPLARLAVVAAAAGVLLLGASGDAEAAKSGGRIGGQAFRSPAPRSSGPRINNNSRCSTSSWHHHRPPIQRGILYESSMPFLAAPRRRTSY